MIEYREQNVGNKIKIKKTYAHLFFKFMRDLLPIDKEKTNLKKQKTTHFMCLILKKHAKNLERWNFIMENYTLNQEINLVINLDINISIDKFRYLYIYWLILI